ncbi:MAG: ribonuclease PH [Actinomycetota bacterium]|nr:ribonuclease PH [Actinomycetota bacterium]
MIRTDGRRPEELRPVKITRKYLSYAEGSVLIEVGKTRVICAVSYEEGVPNFLKGSGNGWITAEYSMLPRATAVRTPREAVVGYQRGRSMEVQRLIGRALRAITDLERIPGATFRVDCDVVEADGGTRTAAITGSYVALRDAFETMIEEGVLEANPIRGYLAAVSAGMVGGVACLDLCFEEDSNADVDMNVVANDKEEIIEIQGTSEGTPLTREGLDRLLDLSLSGIQSLIEYEKSLFTNDLPTI